jgi:hypothetical protein
MWKAELLLVEGGLSSTAGKLESKQNAVALIRDDSDGRDWKIVCYCHHERTWLMRNGRILFVEHEGTRKNVYAEVTT